MALNVCKFLTYFICVENSLYKGGISRTCRKKEIKTGEGPALWNSIIVRLASNHGIIVSITII